MPKIRFFTVSIVLSISFCFSNICSAKVINETEAISLLMQKIEKTEVYESWTKIECLNLITESETTTFYDFSIHEKHSESCPGDPETSPVVDRFRVFKQGQKILWYNISNDQLLPFKQFVNLRKKRIPNE